LERRFEASCRFAEYAPVEFLFIKEVNMSKLDRYFPLAVALSCALLVAGCSERTPVSPTSPSAAASLDSAQQRINENACWGQATRVFAQMGEMGQHASQQPTPRIGLRNLARALYADGLLPDDSLQALGAFVAEALGLRIDACL
jgi:hypothetical protein